jgi:hypothetical protein
MARKNGSHKGNDVAAYIGRDLATVTHAVRFIENLLHTGDQRTLDLISGIRGKIVRRR